MLDAYDTRWLFESVSSHDSSHTFQYVLEVSALI